MQDTYFVRVYDNVVSMKYGQFLMKLEDITNPDGTYLTALEIKDKYALGFVPKYIADVKVPENTIINTGIAGPIQGWGRGGGLQFDLFGQGTGEFTERDTLP